MWPHNIDRFRIDKFFYAQGKDAPGGAHRYIIKGNMIGGFAVIAHPARYGDSGIMSFIVNQDGVVYEKIWARIPPRSQPG
jgi:hypothetical protein